MAKIPVPQFVKTWDTRLSKYDRYHVVKEVYWRPLALVLVLIYGALLLAQNLASNLASTKVQADLKVDSWHLSGWQWAVVALVLLLLVGFEGAVRHARRHGLTPSTGWDSDIPAGETAPPDFAADLQEARDMLEQPTGDKAKVDAWIARVRSKLEAWSPRHAQTFAPLKAKTRYDPVELETYNKAMEKYHRYLGLDKDVLGGKLGPMMPPTPPRRIVDANLVRLEAHFERLIDILSPAQVGA